VANPQIETSTKSLTTTDTNNNLPAAVPASQSETVETESGPPEMGIITFAETTTAAGEPVEPDFNFEVGVTQIHAVFDYANMAQDQDWTQVWYYNGAELYRTSQPWLADSSGRFYYPITAKGEVQQEGHLALEI
jgi:hypothetical protein